MHGLDFHLDRKVHDLDVRLTALERDRRDDPTVYHYVTVRCVMRGCASQDGAETEVSRLLPQHPDETTTYMESWEIVH